MSTAAPLRDMATLRDKVVAQIGGNPVIDHNFLITEELCKIYYDAHRNNAQKMLVETVRWRRSEINGLDRHFIELCNAGSSGWLFLADIPDSKGRPIMVFMLKKYQNAVHADYYNIIYQMEKALAVSVSWGANGRWILIVDLTDTEPLTFKPRPLEPVTTRVTEAICGHYGHFFDKVWVVIDTCWYTRCTLEALIAIRGISVAADKIQVVYKGSIQLAACINSQDYPDAVSRCLDSVFKADEYFSKNLVERRARAVCCSGPPRHSSSPDQPDRPGREPNLTTLNNSSELVRPAGFTFVPPPRDASTSIENVARLHELMKKLNGGSEFVDDNFSFDFATCKRYLEGSNYSISDARGKLEDTQKIRKEIEVDRIHRNIENLEKIKRVSGSGKLYVSRHTYQGRPILHARPGLHIEEKSDFEAEQLSLFYHLERATRHSDDKRIVLVIDFREKFSQNNLPSIELGWVMLRIFSHYYLLCFHTVFLISLPVGAEDIQKMISACYDSEYRDVVRELTDVTDDRDLKEIRDEHFDPEEYFALRPGPACPENHQSSPFHQPASENEIATVSKPKFTTTQEELIWIKNHWTELGVATTQTNRIDDKFTMGELNLAARQLASLVIDAMLALPISALNPGAIQENLELRYSRALLSQKNKSCDIFEEKRVLVCCEFSKSKWGVNLSTMLGIRAARIHVEAQALIMTAVNPVGLECLRRLHQIWNADEMNDILSTKARQHAASEKRVQRGRSPGRKFWPL